MTDALSTPAWIFLLVVAFGALHSCLASSRAKALARRLAGARFVSGGYRAGYNLLAAISLAPAAALIVAAPDREVYRLPLPLSIFALAIQALAAIGIVYSVYQLDVWHFSGLRQLAGWLSGRQVHSASDTSANRLVVDGLHRFVRHPLYACSLVLLWLMSPMTANWLAFACGATAYFYVGSIFEERKLVAEFGDAYRDYQKRVPRLVPRLRRRSVIQSEF